MKKIILLMLCSLFALTCYSSKLSRYLKRMDEKQQMQERMDYEQDTNFADYSFRLVKRYVDEQGSRCRDYDMRSHNNPYRHGYYTICDER